MQPLFRADMILLNMFDINAPRIMGLEDVPAENLIRKLKELLGRPVGIYLEPVDVHALPAETLQKLPTGRISTADSLKREKELGVDFICLTGNPQTGVTNNEIMQAITTAKTICDDDCMIIAGKTTL